MNVIVDKDTENRDFAASQTAIKQTVSHFYDQVRFGHWRIDSQLTMAYRLWGKKVLDAGCGAGVGFFQYLLNGADVIGIDQSVASVNFINERCQRFSLPPKAIVGDLANLPFPDASFDFVFSRGVIHHTPDPEAVLKEFYRVIKPGGEIEIAVYHRNSPEYYRRTFFERLLKRLRWIRPLIYRLFPGPDFVNRFEEPYWVAYTPETLKAQCEAAGLNVLTVKIQGPLFVGNRFWERFVPPIFMQMLQKWVYPKVGWNIFITCRR